MIFATGGWASANLKSSFCQVNSLRAATGPAPTATAPRVTTAGMPAAASITWSTRVRSWT